MRTTGANSTAVHCIQHARVISKGTALVTRASSNARRCRATRSGITRFVRCEASRHHPTTEQVPDSSYNEARRSSSGTASTRRLRQRRQQSHRQQQQQQQHQHTQELFDAQEPSTLAADVVNYNTQQQQGSDGSSTAASESSTPATAISSEQDLNPTTQPVSLLVVELMAPSYAIARMVRIINDDAQLNFTSVAAYAAVEFNKWTHEKRSFRDSSTVKIPDSSYLNMCGSIRDPAVQQQLLSMIQHQLQQSADDYLSTGRGIDGVLVFAAPPSTTYSMPVWHLPALTEEGVEESPYWVDDLNSRLFDADRIVVAVLQTYQSIKALCAAVQHPITQSPVPCGLILQNDWVDLQQQQHSGAAVLQQQNEAESSTSRRRQTASSSSSRRIGSSSGEARNPDLQQRQQLPVILGLHNRPFLEPYLSGVVTHGPLHVVKHYWCSDGHLTRPVTPSVIISDVPGIRGNKCWCGSCDMPLWQMSDEERQQMMQQDSRYLQPKTAQPPPATTAAAAAGGSRRLSRMPHIQQSPPSSPPARLPGQQPPRSVWPEAFVMTAVMTFRQHVAQQMIAAAVAAAAAAGEGRSATEEFVQSAAASSSAARDAATAQLAAANSRARGGARKKRSSSSSSDADLSIQPGQTVSQRTQQLLQRPVTVRGMLWPLLDRYAISFRKKGNKAELVDIVVNYERQQGLLLEDEQQQQ